MSLRSSPLASGPSQRAAKPTARARFATASALVFASSCSLVYDLSPDQCGKSTDCHRFGMSFVCDDGVCIDTNPGSGGSGGTDASGGTGNDNTGGTSTSGGTGGTGGTVSTGGSGGDAGAGAEGGSTSSGGSGGNGGRGGGNGGNGGTGGSTGGGGGMPPEDECETHGDCFELKDDGEPWACVTGSCVALKTPECQTVLPLYDTTYANLRSNDAIIIGAFARTDIGGGTAVIENFDLALEGIALETGGIPAAGDTHRQLVAVLCGAHYDDPLDLLTPVDHLVEDLKVPAILATLDTRDQQFVFEERTREADVFMMVPIESDDTMVDLMDDGLVYHMLSGPHDLAVSYQPLVDMTIEHLRNLGRLGPVEGPYDDARIALVTSTDDRFLNDLGTDFRELVQWNGVSSEDNDDKTPRAFRFVGTQSEPSDFDQTNTVTAILEIAPHIIVGATDSEMTASNDTSDPRYKSIIEMIEERWDDDSARMAQGRPFYILSPFSYGGPRNTLLRLYPDVRTRLLGIGWPATPELDAYDEYIEDYDAEYPLGNNDNLENFYDAAYFLAYGLVAAGPTIRGETIADGMLRITTGTTDYNVGRDDVSEAFSFLSASLSNKIDLTGSNGKPDWNSAGARHNPASVWCLDSGSLYVGDVLTYNEDTRLLEGTFPTSCFTFPAPPP